MSQNVVPAWVYTGYVDGVVQKLQTRGHLLKGTATAATTVGGNEVKWFTGGRMETEKIDRAQEKAKLSNPERSTITANFEFYGAMAFVKGIDIATIKPNELAQLEKEGAAAIGRRSDWIQMDEMQRAAEATEVATIGNGSAQIDILDVMEARDDVAGIGDPTLGEMFCGLPEYGYSRLSLIKEFATADWQGGDLPLAKMTSEKKTFRNVHFFTLPDEYFTRLGGLKGSTYYDAFMWWKGGIGFERKDPPAEVKMQYHVPDRGTYVDNQIGGLSKVIQPAAVKRLRFAWTKAARPA